MNASPFEKHSEPDWPKVRIRVLRPFYWREELLKNGVRTPLSATRVVQPGDEVDAYLPDAESLIAARKAERLAIESPEATAGNNG